MDEKELKLNDEDLDPVNGGVGVDLTDEDDAPRPSGRDVVDPHRAARDLLNRNPITPGGIPEVRKREHYEKPSVKRKKKAEAARKRKYN